MLRINFKYPNSFSDISSYSGRRQYEGIYRTLLHQSHNMKKKIVGPTNNT